MLSFAIRRILQTVPTVLAVVLLIFVLFSVVPGSIVSSMSDDGRGPTDPAVVERLCERAILLDQGRVVEQGTAHDVLHAYQRRLASERPVTVAGLPAEEPGEAIRKAAGH